MGFAFINRHANNYCNADDLCHLNDFLKVKLIMPINNAHAEADIIANEFGFFDDAIGF